MVEEKKTGLELLRVPFEPHQIGKLPKPTAAQTAEVKKDYTKGVRCEICKQWHHPKVIHLDYVGHAALTDRLLNADPNWNWEPFSVDALGQPCLLPDGSGMWLKLTVCGTTRMGFGDAGNKKGGNAIKEIIGDGLRNAGMRFGMALDLWHKGDLHLEPDDDDGSGDNNPENIESSFEEFNEKRSEVDGCTNKVKLDKWIAKNKPWIDTLPDTRRETLKAHCQQYYDMFKKEAEEAAE